MSKKITVVRHASGRMTLEINMELSKRDFARMQRAQSSLEQMDIVMPYLSTAEKMELIREIIPNLSAEQAAEILKKYSEEPETTKPKPITEMTSEDPSYGVVLAIWNCDCYHTRALGLSWDEAFDALKKEVDDSQAHRGTVSLYDFSEAVHYELLGTRLEAYYADNTSKDLQPTYVGTLDDEYTDCH